MDDYDKALEFLRQATALDANVSPKHTCIVLSTFADLPHSEARIASMPSLCLYAPLALLQDGSH